MADILVTGFDRSTLGRRDAQRLALQMFTDEAINVRNAARAVADYVTVRELSGPNMEPWWAEVVESGGQTAFERLDNPIPQSLILGVLEPDGETLRDRLVGEMPNFQERIVNAVTRYFFKLADPAAPVAPCTQTLRSFDVARIEQAESLPWVEIIGQARDLPPADSTT